MVQTRQSSSSSEAKPPKLPKQKEETEFQFEARREEQSMPPLVPENEIDTIAVRVNDYEGIVEKIAIKDDDYQILKNDKYVIIGVGGSTLTLPNVASGKAIEIKNTGGTDVTIDGGDFDIDGAATYTLGTTLVKKFVFFRDGAITDGDWVTF
jgi:hypothetical protein